MTAGKYVLTRFIVIGFCILFGVAVMFIPVYIFTKKYKSEKRNGEHNKEGNKFLKFVDAMVPMGHKYYFICMAIFGVLFLTVYLPMFNLIDYMMSPSPPKDIYQWESFEAPAFESVVGEREGQIVSTSPRGIVYIYPYTDKALGISDARKYSEYLIQNCSYEIESELEGGYELKKGGITVTCEYVDDYESVVVVDVDL